MSGTCEFIFYHLNADMCVHIKVFSVGNLTMRCTVRRGFDFGILAAFVSPICVSM